MADRPSASDPPPDVDALVSATKEALLALQSPLADLQRRLAALEAATPEARGPGSGAAPPAAPVSRRSGLGHVLIMVADGTLPYLRSWRQSQRPKLAATVLVSTLAALGLIAIALACSHR